MKKKKKHVTLYQNKLKALLNEVNHFSLQSEQFYSVFRLLLYTSTFVLKKAASDFPVATSFNLVVKKENDLRHL